MKTKAEYIGINFSESTSSISVQISQVADNEFNFGVLNKDEKNTLFEAPERVYLSKITLNELIELKEAINNLIERVEGVAKESIVE